MSDRNLKATLEAIIDSIDTVDIYTSSLTFDQFHKDIKTRDAVLMRLIVIGETANRVPQNTRDQVPEVEWGRIIRSRHIVAHNYHGIDYEIIWRIAKMYLPPLRVSIEKLIQLES